MNRGTGKSAEEKLSYNENYISVNGSDVDTNLSDRSVDYIALKCGYIMQN